jgi:hypothetical protein
MLGILEPQCLGIRLNYTYIWIGLILLDIVRNDLHEM